MTTAPYKGMVTVSVQQMKRTICSGADKRCAGTGPVHLPVLIVSRVEEGQHAADGVAVKVGDADDARRRFLQSIGHVLRLAALLAHEMKGATRKQAV